MRITSISLRAFRSFVELDPIPLKSINVLIGPNNAGKSSVLRGLYAMQAGHGNLFADVRLGSKAAEIRLNLEDIGAGDVWHYTGRTSGTLAIEITPDGNSSGGSVSYVLKHGENHSGLSEIPAVEPRHFVVPYLSKRKVASYLEDVREANAVAVSPDFTRLAAKLSRLGNSSFPGHDAYATTCKDILGFVVTAVPSANGQRPGVYLPNRSTIPIEQMGEGVPNIVGLLVDLALSERKLFLIEEPENDLHPSALKALLNLIVRSSAKNQFVVSTHSNIVAHHLCSTTDSLLYHVSSVPDSMPPEARLESISATPEARLAVMRELGYSLADFDLWSGWLILEESTAERIIRDYLVPWFAPRLSRVRTIAAGGVDKVEPTFEDFIRLARFMHLEEAYKLSSWVRVDNDERGREIVQRLQKGFATWDVSRFACFQSSQFESFYPEAFRQRADSVLAMQSGKNKQNEKRLLLDEVIKWLDEDQVRGRAALEASAEPVIKDLQEMERSLFS